MEEEIQRLKDKERDIVFSNKIDDLKNKLVDQKSNDKEAAVLQDMKLKMADRATRHQLDELRMEIEGAKRSGKQRNYPDQLVEMVKDLQRRIDQNENSKEGELARALEDVKDRLKSPSLIGGNSKKHREEELADGIEEIRNDLKHLSLRIEDKNLVQQRKNKEKKENNEAGKYKDEILNKLGDLSQNLKNEINDVRTNMADKATLELASIEANANSKKNGDGCRITNTEKGAILKNGLSSGVFTEIAHARSVQDCVAECCHDDKCTLAFMTGDKCFTLACYSETSCETEKTRNAGIYKIQIISIHKEPKSTSQQQPLLKEIFKPPENSVGEVEDSNCFDANFIEDTTLSGGLTVGQYKRHGEVDTDDQCVYICCHEQQCDLVFMIQNYCYTVSCRGESSCDTEEYGDNVYRPRLAFIYKKATKEMSNERRRSQIPPKHSEYSSLNPLKEFLKKRRKFDDKKLLQEQEKQSQEHSKNTTKENSVLEKESIEKIIKEQLEKGLKSANQKEENELKSLEKEIKALANTTKVQSEEYGKVNAGEIGENQIGKSGELGASWNMNQFDETGAQRSNIPVEGVFEDISAVPRVDNTNQAQGEQDNIGEFNDISASHVASPKITEQDQMYGNSNSKENDLKGPERNNNANGTKRNTVDRNVFGNIGDLQTTGETYQL